MGLDIKRHLHYTIAVNGNYS